MKKIIDTTSYLEGLARRIEEAARLENPRPRLFKIADEVRQFKDQQYEGIEDPALAVLNNEA